MDPVSFAILILAAAIAVQAWITHRSTRSADRNMDRSLARMDRSATAAERAADGAREAAIATREAATAANLAANACMTMVREVVNRLPPAPAE